MKKIITTESVHAPKIPISQAVMNDNMLFVSGMVGRDPATGKLANHTVEDEVRQLFVNIQAIVNAAGFEMKDVTKTTIFLTDFSIYKVFNDVYREFFPDNFPARSSVKVAGLLADARIEVEAIAVKDQ